MSMKLAIRIAAVTIAVATIGAFLPMALAQRPGPILTQPGPTLQLPPNLRVAALAPTIEFQAQLSPELLKRAENLRVLRLAPPKFDEGFLQELLARTAPGLSGGERTQVGRMTAVADQGGNFAMFDAESGILSFSFGMVDQIDDRPGELPDERRARAIARDFLVQNGLGPANLQQLTAPYVGRISSASFDPATGAEGRPMVQMLTVYFGRMIDDTEVIGNSSKMIVQIGDGGKVVGAGVNWREVAQALPVGARNVRTGEQIMEDIRTFLRQELTQGERAVVRQMSIFYYDNGGNYIQPVVGYEVQVQAGRMPPYRYFGQTALLLNPPETVGPAPLAEEALKSLQMGPQDMAPTTAVPGD